MAKLTVIGYSPNGIFVGSANAEDLEEARYNASYWLKGSQISTVKILERGLVVETITK